MKKILLIGLISFVTTVSATAQLLITQYYEGASFSKWIELTNVSGFSINLSTYKLSLWSNANTEAYKTNGTPTQTLTLSGTLDAGSSFLLSHGSATLPSYAAANITNNSVINFNGDDSVTLWTGETFTTASIVDVIGFTDAGAEGADTSFYRLTGGAGWNVTAGSTVEDFASVWGQTTNAAVDSAAVGTDPRLGFSSVPEPHDYAIAIGGLLGVVILIRRRKAAAMTA